MLLSGAERVLDRAPEICCTTHLHYYVHQTSFSLFLSRQSFEEKFSLKYLEWATEEPTIHSIYILFQDGATPLSLHLSKANIYIDLLL